METLNVVNGSRFNIEINSIGLAIVVLWNIFERESSGRNETAFKKLMYELCFAIIRSLKHTKNNNNQIWIMTIRDPLGI